MEFGNRQRRAGITGVDYRIRQLRRGYAV